MDRLATSGDSVATHTTTDVLVSYPGKHYGHARREISYVLRRIGEPHAWVEQSSVWGIAVVHAGLDSREVIKRCREFWAIAPEIFQAATKWVPVDYWCETSLPVIKQVIDRELRPRIGARQTWAMRVHKRRWQQHDTEEITRYLAADISAKVNLTRPDWIVWVDLLGRGTAVSLLRPEEIFAPLAEHPKLAHRERHGDILTPQSPHAP